jgi:NADPH:quinone reductase
MKAAAIDRFGPPSVLRLHTLPVPKAGPRQVLIAVHAAGVGVWDPSVRDGSWHPSGRPRFPLVLGLDGSGIVVARGARARRFRLGERVYGSGFGFYAEYVAVDELQVGVVPRPLDLLHAGAGAVTGLTALQGVDDALRLRRGETIVIFGATGAVGTLAVQFAKGRGARVIATATGAAAARLVRSLGADEVLDARSRRGVERLAALAPDGVDAVLALAGGDGLTQCLDHVRSGGRVAYPNGVEPAPTARRRIRVRSYDAKTTPRELARFNRAVSRPRFRVPVAAVFPLAQAARSHMRLERGHVHGRIVLRVRKESDR